MSQSLNILLFTFDSKFSDQLTQGVSVRIISFIRYLAKCQTVNKLIVVDCASSIFKTRSHSKKQTNWVAKSPLFGLERVNDKLYVLHQRRVFPKDRSNRVAFRLNRLLHDRHLVSTLNYWTKNLGMNNLIIWLSNPLQANLIGRFGEKLSVYDAMDDWTVHPGYSHLRYLYKKYEKLISRKAGLIFTVSETLEKKFRGLGEARKDIVVIHNGVQAELLEGTDLIASEMRRIQKPVLGYVGALQERVDTELLATVASAFPDCSIVFVGPLVSPEHFASLKSMENVFFLGERRHKDIPRYINGFDVCLMPHKLNDLTKSMDPIKLYEYLATGRPIVSTFIPCLERFSPYAYLSRTTDEFISNIRKSLSEKESSLQEQRRSFAKQNTWEVRANQVVETLEDYLSREVTVA